MERGGGGGGVGEEYVCKVGICRARYRVWFLRFSVLILLLLALRCPCDP